MTEILKGINAAIFSQFKTNPESFIAEATRLINEQKATVIIEHLAYDPVEDKFDLDIFTAGQTKQDFSNAVKTPKHHIYDFVLPDSGSKPGATLPRRWRPALKWSCTPSYHEVF